MADSRSDRNDQFSPEEDEKLIDLVREHPPLYTVRGRSYKDAVVKNNIWKLIGVKMKKRDTDCKMRWKSIRDYYKRKQREYLRCTGTGTGVEDDAENNFAKKFQHLRFLDNTSLRQRRTITSSALTQPPNQTAVITETTEEMIEEASTQQSGQSDSEQIDDPPDPVEINSPIEEHVAVDDVDVQMNGTQDTVSTNNSQPTRTPHRSSNKSSVARDKTLLVLKEIKQGRAERTALLRELTQMPQRQPIIEKESSDPAITMFFQSIAATVSHFSPIQKAKIKVNIMNVVSRYEMEHLTQSNTPIYSPWSEAILAESSASASLSASSSIPVFSPQTPQSCHSDNIT